MLQMNEKVIKNTVKEKHLLKLVNVQKNRFKLVII